MVFAAVFPGQGSQSLGMVDDLSQSFSVVKETFEEASDVLSKNLWEIVTKGPEELLSQTEITQPLMLAAGVSVWRVWKEQGGAVPFAMAGHSLGEYSALVASGMLDYNVAASLVGKRASLMQGAVPEGVGGMAAVLGLTAEQVIEGCEKASADTVVEAVNFNSPEQTVIGGHSEAVDRAMDVMTEMGAKRVIKLAMSVPSHCSLLKGISEEMASALEAATFNNAVTPVYHNVSAATSPSLDDARTAMAEQLYRPVRWVETIQALESDGADTIVEFGPGKVLFGLNRRINRKLGNLMVNDQASLEKALTAVQG
ncbi:[acyl-carrier-protein] S-malonyltransferase [Leucothrix sargassi]|nr:[acyl-carrier-protein] S-malonyltransferase [Leucothrix sargassi]